jgi:hypothetical protein
MTEMLQLLLPPLLTMAGTFAYFSYIAMAVSGKNNQDHAVHIHFINHFKKNKHRFFTMFPNLLNRTPLAYPLLLHWALSFFSRKKIDKITWFLNAFFLSLIILFFFIIIIHEQPVRPGLWSMFYFLLGLAFTPQLYHMANARNRGISARSIGLFLFVVEVYLCYQLHITSFNPVLFSIAVVIGCGIWFSSMFAQQSFILFSLIMACVFGRWELFAVNVVSVVVFIAILPVYATRYLRDVVKYWYVYYKYLAKIFILPVRYSIYRDLVYDIWKKMTESPASALHYAYTNSLLIVCFLNPFFIVSLFRIHYPISRADNFGTWCSALVVSSLIAFVLCSFRKTRFWGEPERYVEMVLPFSVYLAISSLQGLPPEVTVGLLIYCVVITVVQVFSLLRVINRSTVMTNCLSTIKAAIDLEYSSKEIRFISNNGYLTVALLNEKWSFVYYWGTTDNLGGIPISRFSNPYPYVEQESLEELIEKYKVNICLIDKNKYGDVFSDNTAGNLRKKCIFENENMKVLNIEFSSN